jgi:hypothetical protein
MGLRAPIVAAAEPPGSLRASCASPLGRSQGSSKAIVILRLKRQAFSARQRDDGVGIRDSIDIGPCMRTRAAPE